MIIHRDYLRSRLAPAAVFDIRIDPARRNERTKSGTGLLLQEASGLWWRIAAEQKRLSRKFVW